MYRSYRREREDDIRRAVGGWIFRTAKGIEGTAKRLAPRGASNMLMKSIMAYLEFPISIVAVGVHYAHFVEGYPRTTRRHFTPWAVSYMFKRWGNQRGFDTSSGGLMTWGYRNPFFSNAIKAVTPQAMAQLRSLRL